jgi:hypothetical protein
MECPACGRPVEPEHASCGSCGAVLRETAPGARIAEEEVLYRFGPMGAGQTFSRPGLFVVTYQNCTEIIATTQRLYGIRKMPRFVFARHGRHAGERVFSIPWKEAIEVRRADYLLNAALWIRYRVGDTLKGVGIEAGLLWRHHIRALEEIARQCCPTGVTGPERGGQSPTQAGEST